MYCKRCGNILSESDAFCTSCGMSNAGLQPPATKSGVTAQPARRRKPVFIAIGVAAVAAVIGIAIGFFMFASGGQETDFNLGIDAASEPKYKVSKKTTAYRTGLTTVESFSYDDEGRLVESQTAEQYRDDSGEVRTADIRESITYINDSDLVYEKTVAHAEDDSDNGAFRKTIQRTLNEKGDPVNRFVEEYDGTCTSTQAAYEYRPNGKRKSSVFEYTYSGDVSDKHSYKRYECLFDESGKELECHIEYTDGAVADDSYTRSADGTPITSVRHYAHGSYEGITTYQYDEYGNEISETDKDGTERVYELTLNNEGKVLRKVEPQVWFKDSIGDAKSIYEYQYDDHGNQIYMKLESYEFDSDELDDWGYEVYTEYVSV